MLRRFAAGSATGAVAWLGSDSERRENTVAVARASGRIASLVGCVGTMVADYSGAFYMKPNKSTSEVNQFLLSFSLSVYFCQCCAFPPST